MNYAQFLEQKRARDVSIRKLRENPTEWTVERLATRFKITKQRVSQICANGKRKSGAK